MFDRENLKPGVTLYRVWTNVADRPTMITRVVKSVAAVFVTLVRPNALDVRGERSRPSYVCTAYSLTKREALLAYIATKEAEIASHRRHTKRAQDAALEAAEMLKTLDVEEVVDHMRKGNTP